MSVTVFVDKRENRNVISELERLCKTKKKVLDTADYICSERVAVERKTDSDFVSSIMDGRLFSQLSRMKEIYEKPVLLIERNGYQSGIHPNSIRGALASVALDFSIPILWSESFIDTANIIFQIAKREQNNCKKTFPIRSGKKAAACSDVQEFIVAGLPAVNRVLAKRMLKEFGTLSALFSSSIDEFAKIKGIGRVKAKKIYEIINLQYPKTEKK